MLSARLSFLHKKILIIGGGRQAFKKGQQFKEEGAKITYMAMTMIDAISSEHCIYKAYEKEALNDIFLVYACTDDKALNHQIVLDANEQQILSASVNQDSDATYHPLQSKDYPHLHVALSTNGSSPTYMNKILDEMEENYYQSHHDTLNKLKYIRGYVLKLALEQDKKTALLKTLGKASLTQISFYEEVIRKQKAIILVFHGNETKDCTMIIERFINTIKQKEYAMYYAYLNENTTTISLKHIAEHMELLQIKQVNYQFMLNEKGYCFQKMRECVRNQSVEDVLINEHNVKQLVDEYAQCEQGLLVIHNSKNRQFKDMLKKYCPKHIHVMMLDEAIPNLDHSKPITLCGVFMLAGKHLTIDVMSDKGISGNLRQMGYTVIHYQSCLLQMQSFQDIVIKRLETM